MWFTETLSNVTGSGPHPLGISIVLPMYGAMFQAATGVAPKWLYRVKWGTVWGGLTRGLCWQCCFLHIITAMITSTGNFCLQPWMVYDHLLSRSVWSNVKRLLALRKNDYVKVHLRASPSDGKWPAGLGRKWETIRFRNLLSKWACES